ncbi:hypothetical protein POM88_048440 [Heracleum sosnowskyi]|uniref:Uncharacterized protein n=1 Tax=Heracleum sosnowskyi TaxID=360622 RepID=A0AAD8GVU7_9APIA|nr:hypothetical protein POM88_048440 [Heracleum sosnowskyi]
MYLIALLRIECLLFLVRGNITLTLLPTSNFCISFVEDDGRIQRLGTISSGSGSSSGSRDLYFWSSERSKLLGDELLEKIISWRVTVSKTHTGQEAKPDSFYQSHLSPTACSSKEVLPGNILSQVSSKV